MTILNKVDAIFANQILNHRKSQNGFTLLEIIIVLAIIGAIAGVIVPNLHLTFDNQMSTSLKSVTTTIRETYTEALFSKRMHRMVFDLRSSEYWVEQAPADFKGRPPLEKENDLQYRIEEDALKTFLTRMEEKAKNDSKRQMQSSTSENPSYYSLRSIPEVQKDVLIPITWSEVETSTITRSKLTGDVIFAHFFSGLNTDAMHYQNVLRDSDKEKKHFAYIYFLPDGTTTATSIQFAVKTADGDIDENGPKFTLYLNTLTGQSSLLEGFQNANFSFPKR